MSISTSRGTVFIVEDNADVREAMAELLVEEGYAIIEAEDGKQAMDLLATTKAPSLMLLDLRMPVMNGWELLSIMQHDNRLKHIPVIVMSASHGEKMLEGARGLLQKPARLEELLAVVEKFCDEAN